MLCRAANIYIHVRRHVHAESCIKRHHAGIAARCHTMQHVRLLLAFSTNLVVIQKHAIGNDRTSTHSKREFRSRKVEFFRKRILSESKFYRRDEFYLLVLKFYL